MREFLKDIHEIKKTELEYFSKWCVINSPNKLKALLNNKLYSGFASGFNDVFDSQIRITENYKQVYSHIYDNVKTDNLDKLNDTQKNEVRAIFSFYCAELLEELHKIHISSFSGLNPLDVSSNHMWGLYGQSGHGIAICYKSLEIIDYLKANKHNFNFIQLNYDKNYDYLFIKFFKYLIDKATIFKSGKTIFTKDEIDNFTMEFISNKTEHWKFEEEWRLVTKATKRDHLFDFIKPSKIIFGWNNRLNKDKDAWTSYCNYEIINWAKNNDIELVYLDKTVDYIKKQFNTRLIPFKLK